MMYRIVFSLIAAVLLMPLSYSYGFSTKGQDCAKCHKLTMEEAESVLKELIPNVKVLAVLSGPIQGTWEVDIETGGKKGPMYLDFSKKHLIAGQVYALKEKKNLTQERLSELNKVDLSQVPLGDAIVMGNKDAKYKIVVFDDPE